MLESVLVQLIGLFKLALFARIIIDYVREPSGEGEFNHVHSIVRDPSNDYGAEWLGQHYAEAHQR